MIYFHYENVRFPNIEKQKTKNWIKQVIKEEKKTTGGINFIFCSDNYLLNINSKYLKHYYFTDVITFDYVEKSKINGDIFISVDRVLENAKARKIPFLKELNRVIVHGVLHLLGYKDKTNSEKERMTRKENEYLRLWENE